VALPERRAAHDHTATDHASAHHATTDCHAHRVVLD
jgi:hypothetical protein